MRIIFTLISSIIILLLATSASAQVPQLSPHTPSFWEHPQTSAFLARPMGNGATRNVAPEFQDSVIAYAFEKHIPWLEKNVRQIQDAEDALKKTLELHGFDQTAGEALSQAVEPLQNWLNPAEEGMAWIAAGDAAFQTMLGSRESMLAAGKEFAHRPR